MRLINLLPKPKQQELKYESVLHGLVKAMFICFVGFVAVLGVQVGTKFYLQYKAASVQREINSIEHQINQDDNAAIKAKVTVVNNTISDFQSLLSSEPRWSKVLKAFSQLPSASIKISSFAVDLNKKTAIIAGYAPTREDVIELYNTLLADNKEFYNIDYPLENVAKPKDIMFHFSFQVRDSLLQ